MKARQNFVPPFFIPALNVKTRKLIFSVEIGRRDGSPRPLRGINCLWRKE